MQLGRELTRLPARVYAVITNDKGVAMKLQYTEHRVSVNRDHVEIIGEEFTTPQGFLDAVLVDVAVCINDGATEIAHKLVDWSQYHINNNGVLVGQKLIHSYGTGLDPVGTWEIIA